MVETKFHINRGIRRTLTAFGLVIGMFAATPGIAAGADRPDNEAQQDWAPSTASADQRAGRATAGSSDLSEARVLATAATQSASRIMLDDRTRPVAPDITLRSFEWLDAGGFMRGDLLTVQLAPGRVTPDYLNTGKVAAAAPLEQQAEKRGAVAAVNGDFFDINNSSAPQGAAKQQDGTAVKGPNPNYNYALGTNAKNLGRITSIFLEGTVTLPSGPIPLGGLNQSAIPADGVTAFTPLWGSYTRSRVTGGASSVRELIVTDGVVTAVATAAGEGQLADNQVAIVGRNRGADSLAAVKVGDKVELDYRLRNQGDPLKMAISGNTMLLKNNQVIPNADKALHPRTAVGFNADGSTMYLLTVDGRMAASRGMTLQEEGEFLQEVGATDAINLDGGGSSTLVARDPGEAGVDVENQPSDGYQRSVPDGIGLYTAAGSGQLAGMRLITTSGEENPELWKMFPGLTRNVRALGFDETYAPVSAEPRYRVQGQGSVNSHGVIRAARPGELTVTAQIKGIKESRTLTVLGALDRLRPSVDKVSIVDPAVPGRFTVIGGDANGFEAQLESADVRLDYDATLVTIEGKDGTFTVTPKPGVTTGSVVVTVSVGKVKTYVPVAIGSVSTVIADFSDAASWYFTQARAAGSVTPSAGRLDNTGLTMNFDFTQSTATRVGYARPPQRITLDGQPLAIGAWIHGDNKGEWTSFGIIDGDGKAASLYGPYINWTGWRYVEVPVPQTLRGPIQLNFLAAIETKASASYTGSVIFDDVTVKTAPVVNTPATPQQQDPIVRQHTALSAEGERWTYAVMSDAQFTAANQSLVPQARRTMREIVANKPEFVVITGDLVDTGYPADFALAKQILDEELTAHGVTWYYLPGNHEIYGPGNAKNFAAVFGATHHSFVHKGTRFVLLDSATGTLRGGGFDQWQQLRAALDDAKNNPEINGVVVMWHHPPRDPSPLKNSQMTDRVEAATVEKWLSEFKLTTGKGALFVGAHVGSFSAQTVDGVPYVINGNSAKTPSSTTEAGGFSGWTKVGIDPAAPRIAAPQLYRVDPTSDKYRPWASVEMRPHVDTLTIDAPTSLQVGSSTTVTAQITQGPRTFPLAYPVSASWAGEGINVSSERNKWNSKRYAAAFDPATGELTALRAGAATLRLTVNGVTEAVTITIR